DSSPVCAAPVKPGSLESTPPEVASVATAAEDLERKPVLPRFKLVRDPGSFGYRRLLPLLNEMAKNAWIDSGFNEAVHGGFRKYSRHARGHQVGDVVLPPWVKGSAREFIRKH
ncbi:unnamed protein product, partial [Urochloa humidicola]